MKIFLLLHILLGALGAFASQSDPVLEENVEESMPDLPVIHIAFVQTGNELHYFSETSQHEAKLFSGGHPGAARTRWRGSDKNSPLLFDPPELDFGLQTVGVPSVRRVRVHSESKTPITLISIMGGSVNVHTTFFTSTTVSAKEDAWFELVFLARETGPVKNDLLIHTNLGSIKYHVSGTGHSNPYRIVPFVGTRLAVNGSVKRDISIYNPYPYTFRIDEITSTGADTHIDVDGTDPLLAKEIPQRWELRAFETRTVGQLTIIGAREQNTTVFVRVHGEVMAPEPRYEEFYMQYQFEVTRRQSIFPTTDLLDFGLLKYGVKSPQLVYSVYSFGKTVEFETLYVDKGDATGIYMEFATNPPIKVPSSKAWSKVKHVDLVKVLFDSSRIQMDKAKPELRKVIGRIMAVSRGGNYNVTIPFLANVYTGEVTVFGDDLSFHTGLRPPYRRAVRIFNGLPFALAVWNVSLAPEMQQYMTVRMFDHVNVLRSSEARSVFLLKYNKRAPQDFESHVTIHTNISTYTLPVRFFDGKIEVELYSESQDQFDFGMVERLDNRTIRFEVRNPNPASILLRGVRAPFEAVSRLMRIGTKTLNGSRLEERKLAIHQGVDVELLPKSVSVFDLSIRVPPSGEEVASDTFFLETDYESATYPVSYQVASGALLPIPEELDFGTTHPGRIAYRGLKVFNAFSSDMTVTRMSCLERDHRVYFDGFDPKRPPLLKSGRITNLGRVLFHPDLTQSDDDSYLGVPLHTPDGQWFVHGLSLPGNLAEIDGYLYRRARARYDNLVKSGRDSVNLTVSIDTNLTKNVHVPVKADLVWPRLLTRNSVHFPLTALGNFTIVNLTLSNPSSLPVVVQVIPLVIYPDADAVVHIFRDTLLTPLTSNVEMNETLMFSLRDTELFTLKPESPVPQLREQLESVLKMAVPRFTLSMILKPHMKVRIRLGFLPSDYTLRSSLLLIRNNLTVIEPVVVYGRGARIGMQVGGSEARSRTPLLFEIQHYHLADCNNPKRLMHKLTSTLTVRRPFTVQNTGEVPFTVVNMSVSGVPCESRGFKILNCYPFRLAPNETYQLDLAYTPDFLSTVNDADLQLYMHMNGSAWVFPVAATAPADMLARCHAALPRPPFENLMYYSCVTALIFCLVCVIACAYLEGDRAITCAIREQYGQQRMVFDLNNLEPSNKKKENASGNEKRLAAPPSGIQVREDAGTFTKMFFTVANKTIAIVHRLWRLSLFVRGSPAAQEPAPSKRKKRAVTNAKYREAREQEKIIKEKEEKETEKGGAKKVQSVAPLQKQHVKLSGKPSVSPKMVPQNRHAKKREEKEKREEERRREELERIREAEQEERDRRLSRKTLLIDDQTGTRGAAGTRAEQYVVGQQQAQKTSPNASNRVDVTKRRNGAAGAVKATATVSPVPSSKPPSMMRPTTASTVTSSSTTTMTTSSLTSSSVPSRNVSPVVHPVAPLPQASVRMTVPVSRDPSVRRDPSPSPSITSVASHSSTLQRQRMPTPPPSPREQTPEPMLELSVGEVAPSEAGDLPEWGDENVDALGGNLDDDFSELVHESANLFADLVDGEESLSGGLKPNGSASNFLRRPSAASSESSEPQFNKSTGSSDGRPSRFIQEVTAERRARELEYQRRIQASIQNPLLPSMGGAGGDWPMPDFALQPLFDSQMLRHAAQMESAERMWPPTPQRQTSNTFGNLGPIGGPLTSSSGHEPLGGLSTDPLLGNPMLNPLLDGLSNPLFNPMDTTTTSAGGNTTSNPLDLGGLNLGFSLFNDMADMTWVNNAPVDPETAWASFTEQQDARVVKQAEDEAARMKVEKERKERQETVQKEEKQEEKEKKKRRKHK